MGQFPLLPLIAAVEAKQTPGKFAWPSVDFVASRSRLLMLLGWIRGKKDYWRIDAQLAGANTVILNDCPTRNPQNAGGYGLNYERASTKPVPGVKDGTRHYRIIKYVSVLFRFRTH